MDKETEIMIKAVQENHRKELKKEMIKKHQEEKKNKRQKILFWIIITVALITSLIILGKENEDFIKHCKSAGYSEAYCIAHS